MDKFNLNRFKLAQTTSYNTALAEIKNGRKTSHWIWYILPNIQGLGTSTTAKTYAIGSLDEAKAYLQDPVLGPRLLEITQAALASNTATALLLMGGEPDNSKLRSCMTLFLRADPKQKIFQRVLDKYFDGNVDSQTDIILGKADGAGGRSSTRGSSIRTGGSGAKTRRKGAGEKRVIAKGTEDKRERGKGSGGGDRGGGGGGGKGKGTDIGVCNYIYLFLVLLLFLQLFISCALSSE